MRRFKSEKDGIFEIRQEYYVKYFTLTIDREKCKGCELCQTICPRYAVLLQEQPDTADGNAVPVLVDINGERCDYHGICAVICPFNAITVTVNGEDNMPTVSANAFPVLIRDIQADESKCPPDCKKCEEKCPLGVITVENSPAGTKVEIKKEDCAGCRTCWEACPENAIEVTKFIEGSISINTSACPENCKRCTDVCPLDVLSLDEGGKVKVNALHCVYCGACANVCPNREEAIHIERTAIRHTPISSGAWHKGLEKVTSKAGLIRELKSENASKTLSAIKSLNT